MIDEKTEKKESPGEGFQDRLLAVLYETGAGRSLLKILVSPRVSKWGGRLLETKLSALAVRPFARANGIDVSQCRKKNFDSFNDFFQRELLDGARPIDAAEDSFISPCDGRLLVYPVTGDLRFVVKNTKYTVGELLKNEGLAKHFAGGFLWLLRLSVEDYHHYCYPVTGEKSRNKRIPGVFHTVNPVANDQYPIYKENTREYCLYKTENCGTVLMMEVGAMLVGKIENRQMGPAVVTRGEEKGAFAFGGSTIILLTQKGCVCPEDIYMERTARDEETPVKLGVRVGRIRKN